MRTVTSFLAVDEWVDVGGRGSLVTCIRGSGGSEEQRGCRYHGSDEAVVDVSAVSTDDCSHLRSEATTGGPDEESHESCLSLSYIIVRTTRRRRGTFEGRGASSRTDSQAQAMTR